MPVTLMARNPLVVRAQGMAETGHGVATLPDGRRVYVAGLLPDETALVAIDHISPHRNEAWGHVVEAQAPPSPDRAAAACPAFGQCGGCAWQHLSYPAQLRHKAARVTQATGLTPSVQPATRVLGYRNKGKYVVTGPAGRVRFGAYAPRSHTVIETLGCQVVRPVIDEVAVWLHGATQAARVAGYDERTRRGELRYVVLRANEADDVLVGLVTTSRTSASAAQEIAGSVARHLAVRGVVRIDNDRTDGAIIPRDAEPQVLAGSATLRDRVAGIEVNVGLREFLQVHSGQADAMYAQVASWVDPDARVLDLYAGVGGFALAVAQRRAALPSTIVAIEVDAHAVARLTEVARGAGLAIDARAHAVGDVAWPIADTVIVNPPRKGLGPSVSATLAAHGARQIIYVSCGPDSLGQDLRVLTTAGYRVTRTEAFDLMPGTGQVETVVELRR